MAKVYVGLSGYSYREWQGEGLFYPPGLKQADYLKHYATCYDTVEAVGMWQRMPSEATVAKYLKECPAGFHVSPKMHQKVTHITRLKPEGFETLKAFVEQLGPLEKADRLGSILVQLPPNLARNDALLEGFLVSLPQRSTLRWAMEFRNPSWQVPQTEQALLGAGVAWVAEDTDDDDAQRIDTAEHVYVRLRKTSYSDDQLKEWAEYFLAMVRDGKDCHVYCRHTDVDAPWKWADRLRELVS